MKIEDSNIITDLKVITINKFEDYRGEYFETYNEEHYKALTDSKKRTLHFVVDDFSVSRNNVLRGLHGDYKTWKLVDCIYGEFFLVVADIRKNSKSYLKHETFILNDKNRKQVLIPAGCVNGHLCLSEKCIFHYKQTEYYNLKQVTVNWLEKKLNIYWPSALVPILSARDDSGPFLDLEKL
jgi:dTDP-4-dehydrorhamnose 3,5-epimerase